MTVRGSPPRQNPAYRPASLTSSTRSTCGVVKTSLIVLAFALASCRAPHTPVGIGQSAPVQVAVAAPAPPRPQRAIARPTDPRSYVIESHARVDARADTLASSDTVAARLRLTVTPRGAALDVSIEEYALIRSGGAPFTLATPVRVLGRFDEHGGLAFQGAGLDDCRAPTASIADATRDLWVRMPAEVAVGDVWRDSAHYVVCRDGVPLGATVVRDYRVTAIVDAPDDESVTIARRTTVALRGEGLLRRDTVGVTARGTGDATLIWSARTGWLVEATGRGSLELEARTAGRVQRVTQEVTFAARAGG